MPRWFIPTLLLTFLPLLSGSLFAETKELVTEASYIMGDGETPSFAEAMALQKAKQMALEQAGTYLQSQTLVKNMDLAEDEVKTAKPRGRSVSTPGLWGIPNQNGQESSNAGERIG